MSLFSTYTFHARYGKSKSWVEASQRYYELMNDTASVVRREAALLNKRDLENIKNMKVFPSMRVIQFLDAILDKNERVFNCAGMIADNPSIFYDSFWLLLNGCGLGVSVRKEYVSKLPKLKAPQKTEEVFQIPDSIEGWSMASYRLANSYFTGGPTVRFDYSLIRPEGAIIKSSGRPAPGPKKLEESLEIVRSIFENRVDSGYLRPIDVFDIICALAVSVLAGGVRRSALLFAFDYDDDEMMNAKRGDGENAWYKHKSYRSFANISFIVEPWEASKPGFLKQLLLDSFRFGEPGVLITKRSRIVNPCAEIVFEPWVGDNSTIQFCNLSEINLSRVENEEDFLHCVVTATKCGVLQSTYTNFKTMNKFASVITEKERLLGVSLTGIFTSKFIKSENLGNMLLKGSLLSRIVADECTKGMTRCQRITCVKPSGTVSSVAGCSPGVNPILYKRYIRYIRENEHSPNLKWARSIGLPVIKDPYSPAYVTGFYQEFDSLTWQDSETLDVFVNLLKTVNKNWIVPSSRSEFPNSISSTAVIDREDQLDKLIALALEEINEGRPITGMTILGKAHGYKYAPFTPFDPDDAEHIKIAEVCEKYKNVPVPGISYAPENEYCDGEYCLMK